MQRCPRVWELRGPSQGISRAEPRPRVILRGRSAGECRCSEHFYPRDHRVEYSHLVEYSLENGHYSAQRVSGDRSECEQLAARSREDAPESNFKRHGAVLHRNGDRYFVGGVRKGQTKGKLITEDDVEAVIRYVDCVWHSPELINQLCWTDDQNEDATVRQMLNRVPFEDNLVRDMRLVVHQCWIEG